MKTDRLQLEERGEVVQPHVFFNHGMHSHLKFTRYGFMQQRDCRRVNSVGRTRYDGNYWIYVSYLKIIFNVGSKKTWYNIIGVCCVHVRWHKLQEKTPRRGSQRRVVLY